MENFKDEAKFGEFWGLTTKNISIIIIDIKLNLEVI